MRRKIFALILSVVLCLLFTACNKAETSSSENKSVTNQKNDDSKSKADKINENKSKDEKKADKKEIAKIDDAVLKFTSHYVEVFGKDGDACFDIKFIKDDFIPSDVKGKINVLKTDSSAEKDSSSENNENPKDVMYKHLIINFHDGALYRVSTMEDNANDIKTIKNVYLAKGDAFILDCTNQQYTVDIFSADEMEGHSIIWASDIDFERSAKRKYSIYRWETQRKASDFTASLGNSFEEGSEQMDAYIDLDGDGVRDNISYVVRKYNPDNQSSSVIPSRFNKLTINDKEFDLDKYDMVGQLQDLDYMINIRIIDMDKKDKYKEIAIERPGEHINYLSDVFRYDHGELSHIGSMEYTADSSFSLGNSNDKLLMPITGVYFGFNYSFDSIYILKDGKIVEKEQEIKKIYNYDKKIVVTLKEDVNLFDEKTDEKADTVLKKGDVVEFIETNEKSWIKVKSEQTGKIGYILLSFDLDSFNVKFKNQEELNNKIKSINDVFEDLPQWG